MTLILFYEASEAIFVDKDIPIDANTSPPDTWLWNGNLGVWASKRYTTRDNKWHWKIDENPPEKFKLQLLLLGY